MHIWGLGRQCKIFNHFKPDLTLFASDVLLQIVSENKCVIKMVFCLKLTLFF